jgi:hypothetical protein
MDKDNDKKDWLGDIVVTSLIASFVLIMIGGAIGSRFVSGLGILAIFPASVFFIGAIILRVFSALIELKDAFKKR